MAGGTVDWQQALTFLFRNSELCTLGSAMAAADGSISVEQSLMFFTYSAADRLLLFTSYEEPVGKMGNIRASPNVAVLINSFEGRSATNALLAGQEPHAMTVYGKASVIPPGATDEQRFRDIQSAAHPSFAGAFQGKGSMVIAVSVDSILVVTVKGVSVRIKDPLTVWQASQPAISGSTASSYQSTAVSRL